MGDRISEHVVASDSASDKRSWRRFFRHTSLRQNLTTLLRYPSHPFLIAIYFPIWLWTNNTSLFGASEVYRSILISFAAACLCFLLLRLIYRDRDKAAFVLTFCIVCFYSFSLLREVLIVPGAGRVAVMILAAVCVLVGTLGFFLGRSGPAISKLLNAFVVAMLVIPIMRIATLGVEDHPRTEARVLQSPLRQSAGEASPNIIHIVLDGYSRGDVLRALYGYDNGHFINELRKMGFTVADQATTPYGQTVLAMNSIFSMEYINRRVSSLVADNGQDKARRLLTEALQTSTVLKSFKEMNYTLAVVESAYTGVQIANADYHVTPTSQTYHLTNFETTLLKYTPVYKALRRLVPRDIVSLAVDFGLRYRGYGDFQRPAFIYSHIVAPHPPFDVTAEGVWRLTNTGIADGTHWHKYAGTSHDAYRNGYIEKLRFTNKAILEKVRAILSDVPDPKIILLHSDHGGGLFLDQESRAATCIKERFGVLLAVYFSDPKMQAAVPNDFNLVNLYRVVLNEAFGARLPLLPGRNFYAPWTKPGALSEISSGEVTSFGPACRKPVRKISHNMEKDGQ